MEAISRPGKPARAPPASPQQCEGLRIEYPRCALTTKHRSADGAGRPSISGLHRVWKVPSPMGRNQCASRSGRGSRVRCPPPGHTSDHTASGLLGGAWGGGAPPALGGGRGFAGVLGVGGGRVPYFGGGVQLRRGSGRVGGRQRIVETSSNVDSVTLERKSAG